MDSLAQDEITILQTLKDYESEKINLEWIETHMGRLKTMILTYIYTTDNANKLCLAMTFNHTIIEREMRLKVDTDKSCSIREMRYRLRKMNSLKA